MIEIAKPRQPQFLLTPLERTVYLTFCDGVKGLVSNPDSLPSFFYKTSTRKVMFELSYDNDTIWVDIECYRELCYYDEPNIIDLAIIKMVERFVHLPSGTITDVLLDTSNGWPGALRS